MGPYNNLWISVFDRHGSIDTVVSGEAINLTTMNTIKKMLVYKVIALAIALLAILCWEQVRTPVIDWYDGDAVVVERPKDEPTEFELFIASQEVQDSLHLMFKRHQREELTAEITELESKL